jgi:hypothetical protein
MKRALGVLCAGLLLAGAGCEWNAGSTRIEADVRVNDQSLDVALDEAVAKVQRELQRRGLEATVTVDGDSTRVVARTKAGDQFAVVFSRSRDGAGKEQTRVRFEWGARPDLDLRLALLVALGASVVQGAG